MTTEITIRHNAHAAASDCPTIAIYEYLTTAKPISETTCANTCAVDERLPSKHRRKPNEAGGEIHGQVRCDP
jgi:hypothetical protein